MGSGGPIFGQKLALSTTNWFSRAHLLEISVSMLTLHFSMFHVSLNDNTARDRNFENFSVIRSSVNNWSVRLAFENKVIKVLQDFLSLFSCHRDSGTMTTYKITINVDHINTLKWNSYF